MGTISGARKGWGAISVPTPVAAPELEYMSSIYVREIGNSQSWLVVKYTRGVNSGGKVNNKKYY